MPINLIVDNEICDPIPSRTLYETHYESVLLASKENLFPGWSVCPFKVDVEAVSTRHGIKRPDLALIDNKYRDWWVVEVELSHHSVEGHVAPQVEVFSLGDYGIQHANVLASGLNADSVSRKAIERLVSSRQPKILVVVDDYVESWKPLLMDYADIMVVKPFLDPHGGYQFLIDGNRPVLSSKYLSVCIKEDAMPSSLSIKNDSSIAIKSGSVVSVMTENGPTKWSYQKLGNNSFLFAIGIYPLGTKREFILGQEDDGSFFLKLLTSKIRRQLK